MSSCSKNSPLGKDTSIVREIRSIWTNFLTDTSLHGCHSIAKTKSHWIRRFMWVSLVTACTVLLISYVISFYQYYSTHPYVTKTRVERVKALPFPAISICDTRYKKELLKNVDVLEEYFASLKPIARAYGPYNVTTPSEEDVRQFDYLSFEEYGKTVDDMIVYAALGHRELNLKNDFMFFNIFHMYCYTFNSAKGTKGGNLTLGYGEFLQIILNVTQTAYFPTKPADGALLFLHDPRQLPPLSSLQISLAPGFSTTVQLIPTKMKFLPYPYNSFSDDEYCIESVESLAGSLEWHDEYSWYACVEECYVSTSVNHCGCKPNLTVFPDFVSNRTCTFQEYKYCLAPIISDIYLGVMNQSDTVCRCQQPCQSMQYETKQSMMAYPPTSEADFLIKRGAISSIQDLRENYLAVTFTYERMVLNHVEHVPEYDMTAIVGLLGGQMGLFLGASILTLTELFETILLTVFVVFKITFMRWTTLKVPTRNER